MNKAFLLSYWFQFERSLTAVKLETIKPRVIVWCGEICLTFQPVLSSQSRNYKLHEWSVLGTGGRYSGLGGKSGGLTSDCRSSQSRLLPEKWSAPSCRSSWWSADLACPPSHLQLYRNFTAGYWLARNENKFKLLLYKHWTINRGCEVRGVFIVTTQQSNTFILISATDCGRPGEVRGEERRCKHWPGRDINHNESLVWEGHHHQPQPAVS